MNQDLTRRLWWPVLFTTLMVLCACSPVKKVAHTPAAVAHDATRGGGELVLNVTISADANQNSPLPVDLALVSDKGLLKTLAQMPVADWFAKRSQLQADHAKQLAVRSWEWVPGQAVGPVPVKVAPAVDGAVIFAEYSSSNAKAILVSNPRQTLTLAALADHVEVHPPQ
jgi:type VI secretion system protein